MLVRWLCFVLIALLSTPALAATAWIDDEIYVPVRSGAGSGCGSAACSIDCACMRAHEMHVWPLEAGRLAMAESSPQPELLALTAARWAYSIATDAATTLKAQSSSSGKSPSTRIAEALSI